MNEKAWTNGDVGECYGFSWCSDSPSKPKSKLRQPRQDAELARLQPLEWGDDC